MYQSIFSLLTLSVPKTWTKRITTAKFVSFQAHHSSTMDKFQCYARQLFTKVDASGLAVNRILFGLIWLVDAVHERGLSRAHQIWADHHNQHGESQFLTCRFPLFESIVDRLPYEQMCLVYLLLVVGAFGIFLGWQYRLCAALYCFAYWYLFIIEKSRWNNHSYLFGLLSLFMLLTDGHAKWSLDRGWSGLSHQQAMVPRWHYFLFRFQIFLLYFYAGVKKIDADWLAGYSMVGLAKTWIFAPFRFGSAKLVSVSIL